MYGYRTFLNAALSCSGTKHFCFFASKGNNCYKKWAHNSGAKDEFSVVSYNYFRSNGSHTSTWRETDEELSLLCNDKTL